MLCVPVFLALIAEFLALLVYDLAGDDLLGRYLLQRYLGGRHLVDLHVCEVDVRGAAVHDVRHCGHNRVSHLEFAVLD